MLMYPRGNPVHPQYNDSLAVYLAVADAKTQPPDWMRTANFTISIINHKVPPPLPPPPFVPLALPATYLGTHTGARCALLGIFLSFFF